MRVYRDSHHFRMDKNKRYEQLCYFGHSRLIENRARLTYYPFLNQKWQFLANTCGRDFHPHPHEPHISASAWPSQTKTHARTYWTLNILKKWIALILASLKISLHSSNSDLMKHLCFIAINTSRESISNGWYQLRDWNALGVQSSGCIEERVKPIEGSNQDASRQLRQNKENEEKKRSSTAESGGQHKNRALLWSVDFLCYLGRVECLAFWTKGF